MLIMSAIAPVTYDARWTAADDHEVERATVDQLRITVDLFEQGEDP
jgi:hypothetical protein